MTASWYVLCRYDCLTTSISDCFLLPYRIFPARLKISVLMNHCWVSRGMTLYLPTPERMVRESVRTHAAIVPHKVCFMYLTRLDEFIKQLNHIHACAIPGCKGELIPVHVNSGGQGGAITMRYTCNGCISQTAVLGNIVDKMCEDTKDDVQRIDQSELGSLESFWLGSLSSISCKTGLVVAWLTIGYHLRRDWDFTILKHFDAMERSFESLIQCYYFCVHLFLCVL